MSALTVWLCMAAACHDAPQLEGSAGTDAAAGAAPTSTSGEGPPANLVGTPDGSSQAPDGQLDAPGSTTGMGSTGASDGSRERGEPLMCTGSLHETSASAETGLGCPAVAECSETSGPPLPQLLRAEQLGESARLIDLSRNYVLARRGEAAGGQHLLVRIHDADSHVVDALPPLSGFEELETEALHAVYAQIVVLRCDAERCVVDRGLDGDPPADHLVEFELSELGEQRLNGIVAANLSDDCAIAAELCVYGSGLHCFAQGEWTTEVAAAAGQRLRAVGPRAGCAPTLAVGDDGLVLRHGGSTWERIDSGTTEDFVAVGAWAGRFTAATAGGLTLEGNDFGVVLCEVGASTPAVMARVDDGFNCRALSGRGVDAEAAARGLDTHLRGLSAQGYLVGTTNECNRGCERWVCGAKVEGALDWSLSVCGVAENPRVMTAEAIYGTTDCILVP